MTHFTKAMILSLGVTAFFCGSTSIAEDYDANGINFNLRQDDLDSYWHDTAIWAYYGFRPKTNAHISRFMPSLPSYGSSGRGGYSFGSVMAPTQIDPSMYNPTQRKTTIQMTQYGTWH